MSNLKSLILFQNTRNPI